jgi:hypothetical protein
MDSLKKLLPLAVVGVLSGATTLVLSSILILVEKQRRFFLFSRS